jgi:hypothetical protein
MTISKDPFSIDIVLRHPSCTPQSISKALSLKPKGSWAVGQKVVKAPAKWTFFHACLQKGDYVSKFEGALTNVASFLERNSAFWPDFFGGKGEVELILNHTINLQEEEGDKCFELHLAPEFLRDLSIRGIGLRVQGWQGNVERVNRRDNKIGRPKLKAKC